MINKIKDLMGNKDKKDPQVEETLQDENVEAQEEVKSEETSKLKGDKKKKSSKKSSKDKALLEAQEENTELKDKYLRLMAEFENFKKRTMREKIETMKSAAQDTMTAILPVLDDFDRAKKTAEDDSSTEVFSEGVSLVYQKLYKILEGRGLESMESNGATFDPEVHEAITEIQAGPEMVGMVVDTVEKGYKLNDKIIRHAKVVVGK